MTTVGLKAVSKVFNKSKDKKKKLTISPYILGALKADRQVWKNFKDFPEGYKKVRIGFIENRGRHGDEMFQKSLRYFIKMTAKNKKFGMVQ